MKNHLIKTILVGILISSNALHSHINITNTIKEHYSAAYQATIDMANLYVRYLISTLGHELGHAIAAQLICNQSTRIILGTSIDTKSKLPISVGGFVPVIGGCHGFHSDDDAPIRNLLCMIAGPTCGILTTYFVNKFADYLPYATIKTPFLNPFKNLYYGMEFFRMIPMKIKKYNYRSEGYIVLDLLSKIALSK